MTDLPAGRELDVLVAERVMGFTSGGADITFWNKADCAMFGCGPDDHIYEPPRYSTDIAAAWEVVEKLRAMRRGANAELAALTIDGDNGPSGENYDHVALAMELSPDCSSWTVSIYDPPAMYSCGIEAETAPLAICRAALKAVGAEH